MSQKQRQLTVADMAPHVHSFEYGESKVKKLSDWLIQWIEKSLKSKQIKPYDLLPSKGELACHIGVSCGTMQNVFRFVEDCGYLESKQRVGTYIKPKEKCTLEKLTSKRELAVEAIKKYILENGYCVGDYLISTRKLSEITGMSNTTTRIAISSLISDGILCKKNNSFVITSLDYSVTQVEVQTLVEKIAQNIKNYIDLNVKPGDKLPGNLELSKKFNVSIKTIHDSLKLLSKDGIINTRRGRYGTICSNNDSAEMLYNYEKVEIKIRNYIAEECEVGNKLPTILEFSKLYKISAKTVKKALDNLAEDGYVTFARGRWGGTFVTDIPPAVNEAYRWLALTSDFVPNTQN